MIKYFDLHCDTLTEMFRTGQDIYKNNLHVSLEQARVFSEYCQVFAVWSDEKLSGEEAYERFFEVLAFAKMSFAANGLQFPSDKFILSVEGGRLLCGDLTRIDRLYKEGVRILTPVWGGVCELGGAHDTQTGLSGFGREVIERCFDLNIVVDLSHASDSTAEDILKAAQRRGKPVIASHSCSRAVCAHTRNLTDDMAVHICKSGGIVAVNFVSPHLGGMRAEDVVSHITHFVNICGTDSVCVGGDFDGTADLPKNLSRLAEIPVLYSLLRENGYSETDAKKIFYTNARNFFQAWLKQN